MQRNLAIGKDKNAAVFKNKLCACAIRYLVCVLDGDLKLE